PFSTTSGSPKTVMTGPNKSRSHASNGALQASNGAWQAAHLEDPASSVVLLGEHPDAFVHLAEQPLPGVGQHKLVLHHGSLEEGDDGLAQRRDVGRRLRGKQD